MNNYLIATDLARDVTYVAELARKGSRKIKYSAMPAREKGGDVLIPARTVPREIRRAAKAVLLERTP